MTYLRNIFFLFLLTACKSHSRFDSYSKAYDKEWHITLADNRGDLRILLNSHLDTLFSWTQYSDCGDGCAKIDYRIQPKRLPIFKESGFTYRELEDSVEQFTIKHSKRDYQWQSDSSILMKSIMEKLRENSFPHGIKVLDTIIRINNRDFAVFASDKFDSTTKVLNQFLNAATPLKGNLLEFFFESRKSFNDSTTVSFIGDSFNSIKSIKITTDK